MKKTWDVNVNGTTHTIQYKTGFGGAKILVNGVSYKVKSQNWWIVMIDYPVVIDGAELRVVVLGNKANLAVNGVYEGSGEPYVPLHKMPAIANVFIGISCIGGYLLAGWLGVCLGLLFSIFYAKLGLAGKTGPMVGAFVGCTAIQVVIFVIVLMLQLA